MEIGRKLPSADVNAAGGAPKRPPQTTPAHRVAGVPKDRVEISDRSRTLQAARRQMESLPETDARSVARIKAEIEAGTYRVDAGKIASRMILESLINDLE